MKRLLTFILTILLTISFVGCSHKDQSDEFLGFVNDYMIEELSNDYVSLHTRFENPKDYGIDDNNVEVNLGERITTESFKQKRNKLNNIKEEFNYYNRSQLNEEAKKIYDELKLIIEQESVLSQEEYMYLGTFFEADTGIHIDMTTLFSEWVLRNEEDVLDLITLVKDVKEYMGCLVDFTVQQAEEGFLMIDIDSVVKYCDGIVTSSRNNSVLTAMKESVDKLDLDNGDFYKEELEKAFMNSFIPAYQDISTSLSSLKTYKNNLNGLTYLDNGKEYYSILLQSKIGSNKSVSQVKDLLEDTANKVLKNMQKLYLEDNQILDKVDSIKTKFTSYQEIMEYLKESYKNDFPDVNNLQYDINEIDPTIASQGIAAYFVVPPLDRTNNMQIKVNTHNNTRNIYDIDTYTTIAHEGIPGHMYMYSYINENNDNLYYKLNSNLGFTEGYATYVELYSMKYLNNLNQNALNLLNYNNIYSSCIIALCDIGIHYDGWDFSEFCRYLEMNGMTNDKNILEKQYKQLQSNPAAFMPYYVGLAEVLDLRNRAEEQLGNKFNDKEFHQALIQDGSRTFNVIEDNIKEYIEEHK